MEDTSKPLPFRDDFAARVMRAADKATTRRRRVRWAAATMTASLFAAVLLFASWRSAPSGLPVRAATPPRTVTTELDVSAFASNNAGTQTDPLGYMFPDAEPLSRFSSQYANSTTAAQDPNIFSDEAEEAGGD